MKEEEGEETEGRGRKGEGGEEGGQCEAITHVDNRGL